MTRIGYTLMSEQSGPRDLVRYAERAENAGFDFEVISDHLFPWLDSQGHSSYAWSVLGAVAQVTERVELMTYVTCPIRRYHPVVVAQKAATIGLLSNDRFVLGLGAGENLNEHVVGPWPAANVRHEMLLEAITIINALFDGGYVNHQGVHFQVDSAKVWDLPGRRVPIGVAVSGQQGVRLFANEVDHLIAVEPVSELVDAWDTARGDSDSRKVGQLPICWDRDEQVAIRRAHDQFRWFGSGWKVNAELPGPSAFAGASQFVTPEDVSSAIPCGPDLDRIIEKVQGFVDAGFTDVALVQIGDEGQQAFLEQAGKELLEQLRSALKPSS
ncbi:MAG: Luciferase-like monooxygenase [Marmoricola sp.]|nr:Luciferase-like monooxygenase [Marmoricola sp.]